jgi:hypothetical protein
MQHNIPLGIVSAQAAAYLLEQSLLFDGAAYLSRTSAVAGNRKTWTYSVWCKLSSPEGATQWILGVSQTGTPSNGLVYGNGITGTLRFYYYYNGASWEGDIRTSAVFKDPSAWYHVVIVADMTNATSSDRMRMYVNGTRITSFSPETYPAQNTDGEIGNAAQYNIGSQTDGGNYFSGLMALPILVDGAALDATSFGEEDADGYWNPIEFTGTTTQKQPDLTGSSNIGNMTGGGGLAAAFDGTTSQANTAGAALNNSSSDGTVGKDWGIGNTKTINKAVIIGPNNTSIVRNSIDSQGGTTVYLEASTDNFSASTVSLASASTSTDSGEVVVLETSGASAYRYHRIRVQAIDGSSDCFIAEVQFYENTNSSYGTNGGVLDFADSSWFGLNVAGNDDQTALSAAAPSATAWLNITGAWTMGSGTASRTSTVNAIRSASVFTGNFSLALNMASGATAARLGVYAANEDGTFVSSGADSAGLNSMTNSFYANFGAGNFFKGASSTVGVSQTNGAVTITRVSGTITINTAGGNHEFSATYTGPMRLAISGGGDTMSFTSIAYTADGQAGNSFFDTGFATTDQVSDTPTDDADLGIGNQATLDPNRVQAQATIGNNNRRVTASDITPAGNCIAANIGGLNSGKWFWYTSLASFAADSGSGIFDGDLDFLSLSPNTGSVNNYGAALDTTTYMRRYAGGSSVAPDVSLSFTADLSNDKAVYALDADNGYFWAGIYDASANTIYWIDNANNDMTGNPTDGGTTGKAISGNNWTPFAWATSSSAAGIDVYFGHEDFPGTIPTDFKEIATQNLPITHPLYAPPPAQLRAGVQIHSVTFASNDSGKENASFRQTYLATDVADQAFTRVRFLLEGHSSSTCQYDNLSTGIHTSGGSTAATPVPITVYGTTVVTLAAGSKVWTDWVELTGTAGQVPVLIADIASTNGNLRRLDGGSNTYYEKASTNSYATADISSAGFSSSTRTYIGSKIEVQ